MKKVCVIIPVYKEKISAKEERAILNNCIRLKGIKKFFIVPKNLNCAYYRKNFSKVSIVEFPPKYFKNTDTYSRLMLSVHFYKKFEEYEYMLICQPDVWVLGNEELLKKFLRYDYIGAPWFPKMRIKFPKREFISCFFIKYQLSVGNGGLSLRKIDSTIRILKKYFWLRCLWCGNEDLFFSFIGEKVDKKYKIPSMKIARRFALETRSYDIIKNEGIIPFGVHAYDKYYRELPRQAEKIRNLLKDE